MSSVTVSILTLIEHESTRFAKQLGVFMLFCEHKSHDWSTRRVRDEKVFAEFLQGRREQLEGER